MSARQVIDVLIISCNSVITSPKKNSTIDSIIIDDLNANRNRIFNYIIIPLCHGMPLFFLEFEIKRQLFVFKCFSDVLLFDLINHNNIMEMLRVLIAYS